MEALAYVEDVTCLEGAKACIEGATKSRGGAIVRGVKAKNRGGHLVGPTLYFFKSHQNRSKGEILVKTLDLRVEMPKTWIKLLSN